MDQFWLADEQFARVAPHLPTGTRGKPRVDDRRVISGIVHVLKSGGRWVDAPAAYGPRKTLYNRFVRWAAKGVWANLFHRLAQAGGPPAQVLIDSSAVKAHRCASGAPPRPTPSPTGSATRRLPADRRAGRGLHGERAAPRAPARLSPAARRQGLRQRRHPPTGRGKRNRAQHPAQGQPGLEAVLLARALPLPQRHRAQTRAPSWSARPSSSSSCSTAA